MSKILIAVDESDISLAAFNFYLKNSHKNNNEVLFVHGIEYPYIGGGFPVREEILEKVLEETKQNHQSVRQNYEKLIRDNQLTGRFVSDFCRKSGEHIISVSEKESVSLIVIGTRGMGKIRRTILGSVSEYVLHHAHCPVLIVRK